MSVIEKKLIALCMTRKTAISEVLDLDGNMFSVKVLGDVFSIIKNEFIKTGNMMDGFLLKSKTDRASLSLAELAELTDSSGANVGNITVYSKMIKEDWLKREFQKVCEQSIAQMVECDVFENITELQSKAAGLLSNITSQGNRQVSDEINEYEKYFYREDLVIESGIPCLDGRLTVRAGDLCIVAARPAMGKTAFAISLANKQVDSHVLFFSLEMGKDRIKDRFMSNQLKIDGRLFVNKRDSLTPQQIELISLAMAKKKSLFIYDRVVDISAIVATILAHRLKHPDAKIVVVIDYLQLIKTSVKKDLRTYELEHISYALKEVAKNMNCGVFALCQISRASENRGGDKTPGLQDLKDSGSIEQAADSVLILHRPEYYGFEVEETGESTAGKAALIVAKQRDGETGRVSCHFAGKYFLFSHRNPDDCIPF